MTDIFIFTTEKLSDTFFYKRMMAHFRYLFLVRYSSAFQSISNLIVFIEMVLEIVQKTLSHYHETFLHLLLSGSYNGKLPSISLDYIFVVKIYRRVAEGKLYDRMYYYSYLK